MSALLPIIFHCNPCKQRLLLLYATIIINMKLSFTLFILPLVAAAAQDGNLRDSSPVETANAAADRHHLRRVLTAASVGECITSCSQAGCSDNQHCATLICYENTDNGYQNVGSYYCVDNDRPPKDVDGSIIEEE